MRNKQVALLVCVLLLGLSLPGRAFASPVKTDFKAMLQGFLAFLEANNLEVTTPAGCSVSVTCPTGGVTLSCSGTSCSKEKGRCVKCGKSAQFCRGTTGTDCGTTSSSGGPIIVVGED
jgi:hypothetical protein